MSTMRDRNALFSGRTDSKPSKEETKQMLEQENNSELSTLHGQVSSLRELTNGIRNEVNEHNRLLDAMDDSMDNTNKQLDTTMGKLNVMMETGGNMHMCYLVGLIVFAFVVIYEGFIKSH